MPEPIIWCIVTTIDDREKALRLARESVNARLAACAQMEGPLLSFYHWEGHLEETTEYRIVFKVAAPRRSQLTAWIREKHPYEVPELLAWPVKEAEEGYARWVAQA